MNKTDEGEPLIHVDEENEAPADLASSSIEIEGSDAKEVSRSGGRHGPASGREFRNA